MESRESWIQSTTEWTTLLKRCKTSISSISAYSISSWVICSDEKVLAYGENNKWNYQPLLTDDKYQFIWEE